MSKQFLSVFNKNEIENCIGSLYNLIVTRKSVLLLWSVAKPIRLKPLWIVLIWFNSKRMDSIVCNLIRFTGLLTINNKIETKPFYGSAIDTKTLPMEPIIAHRNHFSSSRQMIIDKLMNWQNKLANSELDKNVL